MAPGIETAAYGCKWLVNLENSCVGRGVPRREHTQHWERKEKVAVSFAPSQWAVLGKQAAQGDQAAPGRPWNMLSLTESSLAACFTLCLYSLKQEKLPLHHTPWSLGRYPSQLLLPCTAGVCRASGMPVAWIQGNPASQAPSQPRESGGCGGRGGQSNPCALGSRSTKSTRCNL